MPKKNFYRSLTDDELFTLLKNDRRAESEFYRRYKIKVKGFVKNYKLNILEREDLIQEGMIGLFHAIETYDSKKGAQFSTYSSVCIRNRILNALDELWKHKKKIDEQKDIEEIVSKDNPESKTILTEQVKSFEHALAELSQLEQKVLVRYLGGKSYKVIAAELEISPKKVDNIMMKIKSRLSGYLSENGSLDEGKYPNSLPDALSQSLKESIDGEKANEN
jgi:RNA polymerase sporulation-specific sigma factor